MYRDTTKNIMEYCIICAEELNQTCRKSVNCPFCEFEACITCCQTYILDREANICMNVDKNTDGTFVCQKPWTRKFMVETFPKKWLSNEWRSMNEKVFILFLGGGKGIFGFTLLVCAPLSFIRASARRRGLRPRLLRRKLLRRALLQKG